MKYLHDRGLANTRGRKVWAFMGDGEMDEPESSGAISLAGREKLDNLIFVINCNLQRLDGPVRGNGKIIQELEADLPRRRLERDQGDLGLGLGPAARAATTTGMLLEAHGGMRRRRISELQVQETAPMSASISSANIRSCWRWSPTCPTTTSGALNRGGHDPHQGLCGLRGGGATHRASRP